MADTNIQPTYPKGITFEQVWTSLDKLSQQQIRTSQAVEETTQTVKETSRKVEETTRTVEETSRQIKELGKRFGDFTNSFGDVVEYMVSPNLQEKFHDLGYDFHEASTKHKVRDKKNDISFEIDVFLQNGDTAMLVEIKSNLTIGDINKHIIRLEKMRKYSDLRGDKRHFLGAVAGIVVEDDEREYALNQGLFLIEPSGENFNITQPVGKPKEW